MGGFSQNLCTFVHFSGQFGLVNNDFFMVGAFCLHFHVKGQQQRCDTRSNMRADNKCHTCGNRPHGDLIQIITTTAASADIQNKSVLPYKCEKFYTAAARMIRGRLKINVVCSCRAVKNCQSKIITFDFFLIFCCSPREIII